MLDHDSHLHYNGVMAHSPPNYAISVLGSAESAVDPASIAPDATGNYPPIIHYNGLPPNGLIGSVNGILSGVLAYCGAQLFVEFLAEMRKSFLVPNCYVRCAYPLTLPTPQD
jgi:hypothetical protein